MAGDTRHSRFADCVTPPPFVAPHVGAWIETLLKADKYTDQKIVETTAYLMNKINEVSAEVRANKDAQTAVNMEQAVYNGTNTATIGCIKQQIAQLQGLSELVVPQRKVCDTCCNC